MAEPDEKHKHDPHDPRGGRTNPIGPQGTEEQEKWQESKRGEAAVRDENVKAGEERAKGGAEGGD